MYRLISSLSTPFKCSTNIGYFLTCSKSMRPAETVWNVSKRIQIQIHPDSSLNIAVASGIVCMSCKQFSDQSMDHSNDNICPLGHIF